MFSLSELDHLLKKDVESSVKMPLPTRRIDEQAFYVRTPAVSITQALLEPALRFGKLVLRNREILCLYGSISFATVQWTRHNAGITSWPI